MERRVRYWLAVVAVCVVLIPASRVSAASFLYNLSTSGFVVGSGTIGFNDTSGSGAADPDLESFSFTVTSAAAAFPHPLPFTFTLAMISDIQWSIGAAGELSLDLDVATQTSGNFLYDISFDNIAPTSTSVSCAVTDTFAVSYTYCVSESFPDGTFSHTGLGGDLLATAAEASVPGPATLVLLVSAVAGVGVAGAWRRRVAL